MSGPQGTPAQELESEDAVLARLDASEDVPGISQAELDAMPRRDAVQPPREGQVHPRSLFGDEPKNTPKATPDKEKPSVVQESKKDLDPEWASRVDSANTLLGKMQVPRGLWETLDEKARVEWADRLKPVYDQNSNVYRELAELKKQVTLLDAAPQRDSYQPPPASASATAKPVEHPGEVNLDELSNAWAEDYGEDAARALRKPFEQLARQNQNLLQTLNGMQGLLRDSIVDGARRELRGEFPQLSDPEVFEKVNETAQVLLSTGRYGKFEEAMRKAAQIELAEELAFKRAQERLRESQARDDAQVTVPERVTPTAGEPLLGEAAEDFVLALLERGYTTEQARIELARRNSR